MSIEQSSLEDRTFFAPEAFEYARAGHVAIRQDDEQLTAISDMAQERFGLGFKQALGETALVYRYAQIGEGGAIPDQSVHKASAGAFYVPANQLAVPLGTRPQPATKHDVERVGRPHQIDIGRFDKPLVSFFVRSLVDPPAEDLRMTANAGAWLDQVVEAVVPLFSKKAITPAKKTKLVEDVLQLFPEAIVLEPRYKP